VDDRKRLGWAVVASATTAAVIYWFVKDIGFPALAAHLNQQNRDFLREAFRTHPGRVVGTLLIAAAVLATPVFAVFRIVYGPLSMQTWRRRSDTGRR